MKKRLIAYWTATAVIAFVYLVGGACDVARPYFIREEMEKLGYPSYFPLVLGTWKILGGVAVLLPGTRRLKEWAYAGITFNLTGAAFSHVAVGDEIGETVFPVVLLAIAVVSWALRPADRKL